MFVLCYLKFVFYINRKSRFNIVDHRQKAHSSQEHYSTVWWKLWNTRLRNEANRFHWIMLQGKEWDSQAAQHLSHIKGKFEYQYRRIHESWTLFIGTGEIFSCVVGILDSWLHGQSSHKQPSWEFKKEVATRASHLREWAFISKQNYKQ